MAAIKKKGCSWLPILAVLLLIGVINSCTQSCVSSNITAASSSSSVASTRSETSVNNVTGDSSNLTHGQATTQGTNEKKEDDSTDINLEEIEATNTPEVEVVKNGWHSENGTRVFYRDGNTLSGWIADGDYYYLDDGIARTGWQQIDGSYYCFDKSGHLLYDQWASYDGNYLYLGSDGKPLTNTWIEDDGSYYYLSNNGTVATNEWVSSNGDYYYVGSDGEPKTTEWIEIDEKWYYLGTSGVLATNQWVDSTYYVGSDGAMLTNTTTPDGYKVGSDGKYVPPVTTTTSSTGGSSGAANTRSYILNTNTHKFHLPSCRSVKQMNEENKWYYTGTRQSVIDMGYVPCKNCNP